MAKIPMTTFVDGLQTFYELDPLDIIVIKYLVDGKQIEYMIKDYLCCRNTFSPHDVIIDDKFKVKEMFNQ